MQISTLREFALLAEKLNFTEAADELFISQPTLSKHIASMEKELGVQLLARDKHGVELTGAGLITARKSAEVLRVYGELESELDSYQRSRRGRFRLGTLYYFAEDYAHPILMRFAEQRQDFIPQLSYFQPLPLFRALENDEIDLGITFHYDYGVNQSYTFFDFNREAVTLAMDESHAMAHCEALDLRDLADETFVMLRSRPYVKYVRSLLGMVGIDDPDIFYFDQIDEIDLALRRSGGISVMPESIRRMRRASVVHVPCSNRELAFPVCIVHKTTSQNEAIPHIIDIARRMYPTRSASSH